MSSLWQEGHVSESKFKREEHVPEDRALLASATKYVAHPSGTAGQQLSDRELAQTHGLDFATAVMYCRARDKPANAEFIRSMEMTAASAEIRSIRIGLVPGAFYQEHDNTGADGADVIRIIASLGYTAEVIAVRSFGSPQENAAIIHKWLQQDPARPVILISLSKGACDLKAAWPWMLESKVRVVAWISLSGICTGTPLVNWLRTRPWRSFVVWLLLKWRRQRSSVIDELRHGIDAPLNHWPEFPSSLIIVHVQGYPLARHLAHPWAGKAYQRLNALGPNDGGGIILADVAEWPGIILPLWGVDHYLKPRHDITAILSQVFQTVIARC